MKAQTNTTITTDTYQVGISENSNDEDVRVYATDQHGKIHTYTSPEDFAKVITEYIAPMINDLYKGDFTSLKFNLTSEVTEKAE